MSEKNVSIPAKGLLLGICFVISFTILLSYGLSAYSGHSPICNPYITGCTDITHTGMYPPAAYVYRFGLIAGSAFVSLIWLVLFSYLRSFGELPNHLRLLIFLGGLGAFSLSLGESFVQPETKLRWHILFVQLFSISSALAIIRVTFFLQGKKTKNQALRMFLLLFAGVFLGINPLQLHSKATEWWAVTLIIVWFLSFYPCFSGYYLAVKSVDEK